MKSHIKIIVTNLKKIVTYIHQRKKIAWILYLIVLILFLNFCNFKYIDLYLSPLRFVADRRPADSYLPSLLNKTHRRKVLIYTL